MSIFLNQDFERTAGPPGVLDQSNWMVDRSVMWQAYHVSIMLSLHFITLEYVNIIAL